jgi:ribosomal protein L19
VAGDVITMTMVHDVIGFAFTGICLSIRKASFAKADCSVILRNVVLGIGIEVVISFFYTRAYRIRFEDHLRKNFFYNRKKIYYLRRLPGNQATRS